MIKTYPILPFAEARAFEESILSGNQQLTESAMVEAGTAIGKAIFSDYQEAGKWPDEPAVLVLCGKGLNTGDALVACSTLRTLLPELKVRLVLTAEPEEMNPLAFAALERLRKELGDSLSEHRCRDFLNDPHCACAVVLDALYGLGFKPPLREEPAALLTLVNEASGVTMRASIDLPSGLGDEADENTFRADFTYIPGVPKAPCFKSAHAVFSGRIRFLEIKPFSEAGHESDSKRLLAAPSSYKELGRLRKASTDKRSYGHCLLLGGSKDMPGAILMATMGALHGGAGLVTTAVPSPMAERMASSVPEAMWRSLPVQSGGGLDVEAVRLISQASSNADAFLIGPGLSMDKTTTFAICRIVRESQIPLVLDASALTQDVMAAVLGRSSKAGPVIITPHYGELARICGKRPTEIGETDLIQASRKYRATVLLKGSPCWVCDGEKVFALPVGGPVLARGGSGDILAGIVTTLLAQHPDNPFAATVMAASWHGAAADSLAREQGSRAVRTTDLLQHLGKSLR